MIQTLTATALTEPSIFLLMTQHTDIAGQANRCHHSYISCKRFPRSYRTISEYTGRISDGNGADNGARSAGIAVNLTNLQPNLTAPSIGTRSFRTRQEGTRGHQLRSW